MYDFNHLRIMCSVSACTLDHNMHKSHILDSFYSTYEIITNVNLRPLLHATDVKKVMLPRGGKLLLASPDGEQRVGWSGVSPPSPSHFASGGRGRIQLDGQAWLACPSSKQKPCGTWPNKTL